MTPDQSVPYLLHRPPTQTEGEMRMSDQTETAARPALHYLKVWPQFVPDLRSGAKPFEARKDDRAFRVGDQLCLYEWDPATQSPTGWDQYRTVTYKLSGPAWGVESGYCILGLSPLPAEGPTSDLLPTKGDLYWFVPMPARHGSAYVRHSLNSATDSPITFDEETMAALCERLTDATSTLSRVQAENAGLRAVVASSPCNCGLAEALTHTKET